MNNSIVGKPSALATLFLVGAAACLAQSTPPVPSKITVKVVGRQESAKVFSYVVPGRTYSQFQTKTSSEENSSVEATYGSGTVSGSGTTTGDSSSTTTGVTTTIPAQRHSYSVSGAVLSLELPDGRIAVVNCAEKLNWTDWSHANDVYRSCRIPPDAPTIIQVQFHGTSARLFWEWQEKKLISLDKYKMLTHKESETYKLIDVLVRVKTPAGTPPKENPAGG